MTLDEQASEMNNQEQSLDGIMLPKQKNPKEIKTFVNWEKIL